MTIVIKDESPKAINGMWLRPFRYNPFVLSCESLKSGSPIISHETHISWRSYIAIYSIDISVILAFAVQSAEIWSCVVSYKRKHVNDVMQA